MNELRITDSLARLRFQSTASLALVLLGALVFAFTLYYSASRLTPLENEIADKQGMISNLTNQFETTKAELQKAQEELGKIQEKTKNARSSSIFVQLGLRQFFVKNYVNAIKFYDKAIEQDSSNPVLFDLRGYTLLRSGRVKESIESLEKSISFAPDYIWGHYNLALAYAAAGDLARGLGHIRKVVELDPAMKDTIRQDGQFKVFRSSNEFRDLVGNA